MSEKDSIEKNNNNEIEQSEQILENENIINDSNNNEINNNLFQKNSENEYEDFDKEFENDKEKENENIEQSQKDIIIKNEENSKNENSENKNTNEHLDNKSEKKEENNNNENLPKIENNEIDGNVIEKEKEEKEENNIDPEILKLQENIKSIYAKNISFKEQLKEHINTLKKEIENNNIKKQNYIKKIEEINKETKEQTEQKKTINYDMKNLENLITAKINKIVEYQKLKKGKNSVERSKKELFLYQSSEDLINIKQKQLKNVSKLNNILDKDISKINSNLKRGYYIDQDIKEENPEIKTKVDELNYIYNKLNTDISLIKSEIQILKNVKDAHNKCDKKIEKLKRELDILKEKKDINIIYSEIRTKDKEMNELKRQQIVANKGYDFIKFKKSVQNRRYKQHSSSSSNEKIKSRKEKDKNYIFLTINKTNPEGEISNEINIIKTDANSKEKNENLDNKNNNTKEEISEDKYKEILKLKIEEKNIHKRKVNNELKEIELIKSKKESELRELELKKFNLQKSNYDLQNFKKLNETKIKKLKKQINDLTLEEENYINQIAHKEKALEDLKVIVDSVNSMQKLRV